MIKTICNTKALKDFLYWDFEDAGVRIDVDQKLEKDEYVGIKVDDYYHRKNAVKPIPKAVDFLISVDCSSDAYVLYIIELKGNKKRDSFTAEDIQEKFETTIEAFMKREYADIYCNDRYRYKDVLLYLVSTRFLERARKLGIDHYKDYVALRNKISGNDTVNLDVGLSGKLYNFRGRVLKIERELPPYPVVRKM